MNTATITRRQSTMKAVVQRRYGLPELVEARLVTPVIDRAYPLSQAAEALTYLGAGHTRGKVVVTVSAAPGDPAANPLT